MRINDLEPESKWIIDIDKNPKIFKKESVRRLNLTSKSDKYETELWQLCYQMGATHLSAGLSSEPCPAGSKFHFHEFPNHPPDSFQMDVVAIIRDYAICISATTSAGRTQMIEKERELRTHNEYIAKRIDKLFPESNLKKIFILASDGFNFSPEDMREFTKDSGIIFLRREELKYVKDIFSKSGIKYFTFNQFLNFFYRDLDLEDFFEVKASKSSLLKNDINDGNESFFYTFTINPGKILPLCSIAHRKAKHLYSDQGQTATYYQRLLDGSRVSKISEYISQDNGLPFVNNILLSYRGNSNFELESLNNYYNETSRNLKIFNSPGMFHVIDGQHRLFSYSPELHPDGLSDDEEIIVTIVDGIDIKRESELFVDINKKQKTVNPNLLDEIELIQGEENSKNLCTALALALREDDDSAFNNPKLINDTDTTKNDPKGKFNFSAISKSLEETSLIQRDGNWKEGYGRNRDGVIDFLKTKKRVLNLLNSFFSKIKDETKWKIRSRSIDKGIIISALIIILDRFIKRTEEAQTTKGDIFPKVEKLTIFFIDGLKGLSDNELDILTPKSFLGGQKYKELASVLIKIIFKDRFVHINDPNKDDKHYESYQEKYYADPLLTSTLVELEDTISRQDDEINSLKTEIDALRSPIRGVSENERNLIIKSNVGKIAQRYEKQIKTRLHIFLENELESYSFDIRQGQPTTKEQYREKLENIGVKMSRSQKEIKNVVASIVEEENRLKSEERPLYFYDASYLNPQIMRLLLDGLKKVDISKVSKFPPQIKDKINKYFEIPFDEGQVNFEGERDNSNFYYLTLMNRLRRYEAGHFAADLPGEIIPIKEEELNHFYFFESLIKEKISQFDSDYNFEKEIELRKEKLNQSNN